MTVMKFYLKAIKHAIATQLHWRCLQQIKEPRYFSNGEAQVVCR